MVLTLHDLEWRSVAGSQDCVCKAVQNGGLGKEFLRKVVTKDDALISSEAAVLEGNKEEIKMLLFFQVSTFSVNSYPFFFFFFSQYKWISILFLHIPILISGFRDYLYEAS